MKINWATIVQALMIAVLLGTANTVYQTSVNLARLEERVGATSDRLSWLERYVYGIAR
jgi:hypothetical protein